MNLAVLLYVLISAQAAKPVLMPKAEPTAEQIRDSDPTARVMAPLAFTGKLLLFDGKRHKTFLGCLNCAPDVSESVWKEGGEFGPGLMASLKKANIWKGVRHTVLATEGGDPFCRHVCYKAYPIIVDEAGHYFGEFSVHDPDKCLLQELRMTLLALAAMAAVR